jgi:hypothetical protein
MARKKDIKEIAKREIKEVTHLGGEIPSGLRFGIIVSIALIWVQVIRSIFSDIFSLLHILSNTLVDFIIALIVTFLGYLVLLSYRKIRNRFSRFQEK